LGDAGLDVETTDDVTGAELAACAKNAAALAAAVAATSGMNAAGAAAARVFAETHRLALRAGGRTDTFMGLAGTGDLVGTVLAELVDGDKAALDRDFEELYKSHLRDVYSYSYYRVGNHHDAEDLTEQTFLQAYRHFERAQRESQGRPLRPWLIRIAHNLAANYYRDRSRRPQTSIEDAGALAELHTTEGLV